MAGFVDFLVFDLLTGDEDKNRLKAKRRSVIFEGAPGEGKKKSAPSSAKPNARSSSRKKAKR